MRLRFRIPPDATCSPRRQWSQRLELLPNAQFAQWCLNLRRKRLADTRRGVFRPLEQHDAVATQCEPPRGGRASRSASNYSGIEQLLPRLTSHVSAVVSGAARAAMRAPALQTRPDPVKIDSGRLQPALEIGSGCATIGEQAVQHRAYFIADLGIAAGTNGCVAVAAAPYHRCQRLFAREAHALARLAVRTDTQPVHPSTRGDEFHRVETIVARGEVQRHH